jgi:hypothetical protein
MYAKKDEAGRMDKQSHRAISAFESTNSNIGFYKPARYVSELTTVSVFYKRPDISLPDMWLSKSTTRIYDPSKRATNSA